MGNPKDSPEGSRPLVDDMITLARNGDVQGAKKLAEEQELTEAEHGRLWVRAMLEGLTKPPTHTPPRSI